jgi:hypothetical protein
MAVKGFRRFFELCRDFMTTMVTIAFFTSARPPFDNDVWDCPMHRVAGGVLVEPTRDHSSVSLPLWSQNLFVGSFCVLTVWPGDERFSAKRRARNASGD